jgi:Resolvase, N terminal domain
MTKRVALYLRVSTDEQTTANQRRELEAVVERHGWQIVKVFGDTGISGKHGRDKRPGFDQLCRAVTRKEFDLIAAWSVDRLGRSLQDLVGFLAEIHGKGVDLFLLQQGIDTSSPAGKALFQMMGVFAGIRTLDDLRAGQGRHGPRQARWPERNQKANWPAALRRCGNPGQARRGSIAAQDRWRPRCLAVDGQTRRQGRRLRSSIFHPSKDPTPVGVFHALSTMEN